ncbi:MAG: hypothetical protein CGW95_06950 [Phenylobacterium zucineum]|nr:MAG: hypothetical protein CGW95_06950 [Phenylobacterium zucineum]
MSGSVGWVAVQGMGRHAMLDQLNLVEIGEASDCLMGDYACTELADGWVVVVARNASRLPPRQAAERLSANHTTVGGKLKDSTVQSRAFGYENGVEVWRVEHDSRIDIDDLTIVGTPPDAINKVRSRVKALVSKNEAQTDWFYHVPLELSLAVCGFRPDGSATYTWTLLQTRGQKIRPRYALRGAMQHILVPFLLDQGWTLSKRPSTPGDISEFEFQRVVGTYSQYLMFDYLSAPDPMIFCRILVWDDNGGDTHPVLHGEAITDTPLLGRLKRFLALGKSPKPEDAVRTAIDQAKVQFARAQAFLDTGELGRGVSIALMRGVKSWPE